VVSPRRPLELSRVAAGTSVLQVSNHGSRESRRLRSAASVLGRDGGQVLPAPLYIYLVILFMHFSRVTMWESPQRIRYKIRFARTHHL
jgi:hypothetical protein